MEEAESLGYTNGRGAVLTLDIGSARLTGGLVTGDASVSLLRHLSTMPQQGSEAVIERIITLLQEIREESQSLAPGVIGISTTGFTQSAGGAAFATTAVPGWGDIPVVQRVADALGLPAFADSDAHLMTLGEALYGAGRGYRHLLGLTVGTGIRGGLLIDGKLYHGAGDAAGGVGHMTLNYQDRRQCPCGRYGCLETHTSVPLVIADFIRGVGRNRVRRDLGLDPRQLGTNEVADLARGGRPEAIRALEKSAGILGTAVASLINLFNPEAVVIGGEITQFGEIYFSLLRQVVQRRALSPVTGTPILPAQLGLQGNLLGAACLARNSLANSVAARQEQNN